MANVIQFPVSPLVYLRIAERDLIERCKDSGSPQDRAELAELQLSLAIARSDPNKDVQLIWDETLIRIGEQREEITSATARELFRQAIVRYRERVRSFDRATGWSSSPPNTK